MLYTKEYSKDSIDINKLMSQEHIEIWNKRKVAHFLNSSYEYVLDMPYDEFRMCLYLCEIESLCRSEEGQKVLENNIRYTQTEPDVGKLRKKYGRGVRNG